jgi:hypothetical protein
MTWLARVRALKIKVWSYIPQLDPTEANHIGPMAEQWSAVMGLGNGITIDPVDGFGVCLKAIQELAAENDLLRARISKLEQQT